MYCYIFIRNKLIYSVSFIHHLFAIFINKLFYLYKFSNKNKNSNKIFRPRYLRDRKWNEMKTKGLISRFFFTSSLNITRATSTHLDISFTRLSVFEKIHFYPTYYVSLLNISTHYISFVVNLPLFLPWLACRSSNVNSFDPVVRIFSNSAFAHESHLHVGILRSSDIPYPRSSFSIPTLFS